ncbi:hypothetical protein Scep_027029 [Stephania cephalantha]|uniref:Uncharacterized protein n=1 Tax=Stephania cephalantha TaxID=152367 RepID=A0AAP0EL88_9MAGN
MTVLESTMRYFRNLPITNFFAPASSILYFFSRLFHTSFAVSYDEYMSYKLSSKQLRM